MLYSLPLLSNVSIHCFHKIFINPASTLKNSETITGVHVKIANSIISGKKKNKLFVNKVPVEPKVR